MRFNDMLATILALPDENPAVRIVKWRQLVDLLAQRFQNPDLAQLGRALDYLREHRADLDGEARARIAASLGGRLVSPEIVRFFAEDEEAVVSSLVSAIRLLDEEWIALLPGFGESVRHAVKQRSDLSAPVFKALADLEAPPAAPSEVEDRSASDQAAEPIDPGAGERQIQQLVARIEQFRTRSEPAKAPQTPVQESVETFRWETGADGVIMWVEGAPRGPVIGLTIGSTAEIAGFGVDGQAAGAFEKKSPFRDARLSIAGTGPASGEWRISGVPFFHSRQGSFLGYRGTARRPRLDEVARTDALGGSGGLFGTAVPAESLRNLIHELRTPLNAILGFAEMIEGQYLGPAGSRYRERARGIMEQADRLLAAVDDLDTAARVETNRLSLTESAADAVALLSRLHKAFAEVARLRDAKIDVEIERDLPQARVDPTAAERMFARLLGSTIALLRPGESLEAKLSRATVAGKPMLCLIIDRPQAIEGTRDDLLLDPGFSPNGDGPGAPLLGLGFSLRLVRNLAEAVGGMLLLSETKVRLYLPVEQAEQSSQQGA